ncbi:MAG: ABC transporter substrate-binding protein, partial [Actinomycetota bacterium]
GSASSSPSTTSTTVTGTLSTPSTAATGSVPEPDRWPGLLRADCDTTEPDCNGPWEAAWEADRRAVIDRIVSGGHGLGADGVLRGPGGLAVDLSACPPSWATEGIEADRIRLGFLAPNAGGNLIGPNPTYGITAYLEAVNRAGGIDGREVDLAIVDQPVGIDAAGLDAADIDRVVADHSWFALTSWGDLGLVDIAEIAETLEARCVPHALPMDRTASSVAGEHPFTIPYELSYEVEAELWIEHVAAGWTDTTPPHVAALVIDHPYGHRYLDAVTAALEDRLPEAELTVAFHDPASPGVGAEVAELLDVDPDVWLSLTAANACLLAINEVGTAEARPPLRFTPSGCEHPAAYVEPAGDAAEGWLVVTYRAANLADWDRRVGTLRHHIDRQVAAAGFDSSVDLAISSWAWAWHYVELLRIASALPGGLTRPNLLLAGWSADLRPPLNHPMIRFTLHGPTDPQPIETARVRAWNSRQQRWDDLEAVSVEGDR